MNKETRKLIIEIMEEDAKDGLYEQQPSVKYMEIIDTPDIDIDIDSDIYKTIKNAWLQGYNRAKKELSQLPEQEISDEEIKKSAFEHFDDELNDMSFERFAFVIGCKWYREQLKQK